MFYLLLFYKLKMKFEHLAVRFKSADVAEKFKEAFEQCQQDGAEEPAG